MQLQKLKEGPVLAQTTSSEMLRKALSEKQVKRNGKKQINKTLCYMHTVNTVNPRCLKIKSLSQTTDIAK